MDLKELQDKYERDGYAVLDPELSEEVVDGVVRDLDGLYFSDKNTQLGDSYDPEKGVHQSLRFQDAWEHSENAKKVALAPKILDTLRALYEREPWPFQTLNFPFGTGQLPHSDTIHFNSMPAGYMCGVWLALEDIDGDNGPLIYYPGSHKLPEYIMPDVGVPSDIKYYPEYEKFLQRVIQEKELQPAYATIQKGQAFLWSANLLHGGAPMNDHSRTRHSQVTHYFFEGCRHYTPMFTQYHMRTPARIQ